MHEAVGELVAIIRQLRPHVVVTYDPDGGYGHPDHIQAHRVTTEAVAASAGSDYPGEPWQVPKFYWTVSRHQRDGRRSREPRQSARGLDAGDDRRRPVRLSRRQDRRRHRRQRPSPAKIAALRAHATQVTVAPNGHCVALSNNIALPILAEEHYILVSGEPGDRDHRGWETDLLAGLSLG